VVLRTDFASGNADNVIVNPHPIAKLFAPVIFLSLALLTMGFSFGPEPSPGPETPVAAPSPVSTSQ
jgi:hypothetical protein